MLNDLGSVALALGLMDEAISWDLGGTWYLFLPPTASPRACTTVGWRLGNLLAEGAICGPRLPQRSGMRSRPPS